MTSTSEVVHEGEPQSINENDEIVVFASVETLLDELSKRFSTIVYGLRSDDGEIIIDWGGKFFDPDYAMALCDRCKLAIMEDGIDQKDMSLIDRQNENELFSQIYDDNDNDDDDDDQEDEFSVE